MGGSSRALAAPPLLTLPEIALPGYPRSGPVSWAPISWTLKGRRWSAVLDQPEGVFVGREDQPDDGNGGCSGIGVGVIFQHSAQASMIASMRPSKKGRNGILDAVRRAAWRCLPGARNPPTRCPAARRRARPSRSATLLIWLSSDRVVMTLVTEEVT